MHLRNGEHGYGLVTQALHWLTVVAIAAQFAIGWSMDTDSPSDRADDRVDAAEEAAEERAERLGAAAQERLETELERREDAADALPDSVTGEQLTDVLTGAALVDGVSGVEAHLLIGLVVAALGLARLGWRRATPLPPWAEHLSGAERKVESWSEKMLLALLLVVPGTGLMLVLIGGDLVAVHVAAQVALLVTVSLHVGLVLKHTVLHRNRHLSRMW